MQSKFKQILSLVMVACMMLALLPVTASIQANAAESYTWTKVALSDISATDTIAITMSNGTKTWALTNNNGTSKAPVAKEVTVSGNSMTSTSSDDMAWNISISGSDLTIYVAGSTKTWLYSTKTNNGVRVGTNTNKTWIVDSASGYLKHTGTSRYLGVYNGSDWRAYTDTTGNTKGQTLAFWKLNVNTTPECEHSYESVVTAPTCTAAGYTTHTCTKCGDVDVNNQKAALGHSFVNGICSVCNAEDNSISGRYYIAAVRTNGNYWYMTNSLGTASTKRYQAVDSGSKTLPTKVTNPVANQVFVLEMNADETYYIYAEGITATAKYLGWTSGNSGTLVGVDSAKKFTVVETDGGLYNIYFKNGNETRYLSLNSATGNNYFAFYTGTQAQNLALIPVKDPCSHEWDDATCTAPKTCSVCGETEGDALGHSAPVYTVNGTTHSVDYPCCNAMDITEALHVYTEGACICGAIASKSVTINMVDSYGDGWGGNAINIFEDGILIGTATISSGANGTYSFTMEGGKEYDMFWVKGTWSSECSFEIVVDGEVVFSADTTACNLFANNAIIYPPCPHANCDAVVTAPTCKDAGYTTYTCTKCGESFTGDETPALGHAFGDDDVCDVCGYDKNIIYVSITLNDSYGDSWNGNQLHIYENGVLFAAVELENGLRTDTVTLTFDRSKEYDFFWYMGNFARECSFTIYYDGEVVYTATQSTCSGFSHNQLIYPACQHVNCDAVVTPPTCLDGGYTTFTCRKCGESFTGDIVPNNGHQYGDDSVCDDCGFDKEGIVINMTDSYGDGWNGNTIEIYEDGELVAVVTLDSGSKGMFVLSVDSSKEYTFNWTKGSSSGECSFEIIMAEETVFSAGRSDCDQFISGQQVYPYFAYSGWTELGGKVYYFDPVTNKPVSSANRLPYPDRPLNGITYAPNPEDVAYAESLGQTFIDKYEAWFLFDNYTCELMQDVTAIRSTSIEGYYGYHYVVNGMMPWHVGLVEEFGNYWYFTGDPAFGGNTVIIGDGYVFRNNTDFDMVVGGIYTFNWNGNLCFYDGITMVDGVLRYYENCRLMAGNGLTKVGENYIYVSSNGELVVDREYYVPVNDLGIASGTYTFDENGYLLNPIPAEKNGVYFENDAWYYYENGKIAANKGLIAYGDGYIYVRSNGKLAIGEYYITNVSNDVSGLFATGMKVYFDENGITGAPKNGIIDGFFYEGGHIAYNKGLIAYNGSYIYVRSNGKVATGAYWITNTNGLLAQGCYEFGADGLMVLSEDKDGIVEENGVLCYYEGGKKVYGAGLIQVDANTYIYVRSNGQLAVGKYWPTTLNGYLEIGEYDFGTNGLLVID